MKFLVASDHAGKSIKERFIEVLKSKNIEFEDLSPKNTSDDDYPDFAKNVCKNIKEKSEFGFLSCGTGIGMSIAANKYKGIRAALVRNSKEAVLARAHNNANVLVLNGSHHYTDDELLRIVENFLNTKFQEGRHKRRINKLR